MIDRRELLIGAAALAACAAQRRAPRPPLRAWPPFASTIAIDGAAALDLLMSDVDDKTAAEIAKTSLEVAHACGLTAVVMTVAPTGRFWLDDAALERCKASIATIKTKIAAYPGDLMLIQTAADLAAAHQSHRLGVIFTFQGTEPLGEDTDRIAMFREMGIRVIQLTHNRHNLVGDGATEAGNAGLSNYGREVVEKLNAARIVVDLAHGSQRTIKEGIAASRRPVLISHTGCRALSDLPRNTGDAELRALADKGGVAGMIFWPYLRKDTQPMAADLIAHLEHAIDVAGEDHVGIGSDTSVVPVERTPAYEKENRELVAELVAQGIFEHGRPADLYMFLPDLNAANRYEMLATLLAARGHSDARIAKILGGNFARVLRETWG
ncbi:MAG: peptidase M19 [Deltaproteobacteria bacterium]|nr:MAG: peptidase M19 [Deltaproteobacteria bacterium]